MFKITWRAARVNRGLTLRDVAQRTGKDLKTIQKYEKDSSNIPRDLMVFLLELYGVPFDIIFCGRESDFIGITSEAETGLSHPIASIHIDQGRGDHGSSGAIFAGN